MTLDTRDRIAMPLAAVCLLLAGPAFAFSSGPNDGLTGAPGENTCTQCHGSFPLNSGDGSLGVSGFPAEYTPGETYSLTVTLDDPQALRWGFELTLLEAGGASAGAITVTDSGTQSSTSGDRDYLKHNASGTYPGSTGSASWQFDWQAPEAGAGDLTLYVAGNAANNNFSTSGDYIYNASFATAELTGVGVGDAPVALRLLGNAPNPFNPATRIAFVLGQDSHVSLSVFTPDGRRVATLVDGQRGAGQHTVTWDGRDHAGQSVGSGTYLYVARAGDQRQLGRMTLLK